MLRYQAPNFGKKIFYFRIIGIFLRFWTYHCSIPLPMIIYHNTKFRHTQNDWVYHNDCWLHANVEKIAFHLKSFISFFTDEYKIIFQEGDVTNSLNGFFSNIVKNLESPAYAADTSQHKFSNHPTLQAIIRYRNHSNC